MTERADIESLAAAGACPGALRYVSTIVTQHQCERGPHADRMHWNDVVVWFGPPEPVERLAS